jgi:hypothetical protein
MNNEVAAIRQTENSVAFKEWAAVCAALGEGRQTIILRKGGIHEGRQGFHVNYGEFWLFPTNFHQLPESLTNDARPIWERARQRQPPADSICIRHYAVVHDVIEIHTESAAVSLRGHHIWSDQTVRDRFHYRHSGLFLLAVRMYVLPHEITLANDPSYAGCRSWVDLEQPLSTAAAAPVLTDTEFQQRMQVLQAVI